MSTQQGASVALCLNSKPVFIGEHDKPVIIMMVIIMMMITIIMMIIRRRGILLMIIGIV